MNLDLACSLVLLALPITAGTLYAGFLATRGTAASERVEREHEHGRSALLTKGTMEMFYWALGPAARGCLALGLSANAVTLASLFLALASGVSIGAGHVGLGGLLAAIAGIGDALDGLVAKASGQASEAGEVLDAAVDRYGEIALLGGVAVYFRSELPGLVLALLALTASVMVSYSTAKAEALRVMPPRGSMRRSERAVVLTLGFAFVPVAALFGPRFRDAPLVLALVLVASIGNVSAVRRLLAVAREVAKVHPAGKDVPRP